MISASLPFIWQGLRNRSWVQVLFQRFVPLTAVRLEIRDVLHPLNLTLWTTVDGENITSAMRHVSMHQ